MNTSLDKSVDPRVECAAAHVAKLFSGKMSEGDIRRLEVWLSEDPRNRDEYELILELWDLVENVEPGQVEEPDIQAPRVDARSWFHSPRPKVAAGIFAVLIAFSTVLFSGNGWLGITDSVVSYETAVGEHKTIELPDGSTITLNTVSGIQVDFVRNERRLKLEHGEAFFDVAKDPSRPFVIEFGVRKVTVLGTRFNIYMSGSVATIAVVEGLVRVDSGSDPGDNQGAGAAAEMSSDQSQENSEYYLAAGKTAVFSVNDEDAGSVVALESKQFRDWRSGLVRFDNESLIKVVAELNRYSDRKVLIEDPDIVELQVSGIYQLAAIDKFLSGIDAALPVRVVRYVDRYVIVGEKEQ